MFDQREKIAIFIEGPNVYAASRNLELEIDYKRLLAYFRKKGYLLRAHYYTTLPDGDDYSSIRPLIDYLDYNGYRVVTKPVKTFTDEAGNRKFKGNMSVEIATDMLEMAGKADHLFYVGLSADDEEHPVQPVQAQGSRGHPR